MCNVSYREIYRKIYRNYWIRSNPAHCGWIAYHIHAGNLFTVWILGIHMWVIKKGSYLVIPNNRIENLIITKSKTTHYAIFSDDILTSTKPRQITVSILEFQRHWITNSPIQSYPLDNFFQQQRPQKWTNWSDFDTVQ